MRNQQAVHGQSYLDEGYRDSRHAEGGCEGSYGRNRGRLLDQERFALILDSENILFTYRETGTTEEGIALLGETIGDLRLRGPFVSAFAVCDQDLRRRTMFLLGAHGVRVFPTQRRGKDAADLDLLDRMETDLPSSVTTVVFASGDGVFSQAATRLRAAGCRVEVVAVEGRISAQLYMAADSVRLLPAAEHRPRFPEGTQEMRDIENTRRIA